MAETTKPRIAFFGTPDFAVYVLEGLKNRGILPDLVVTAPDAPKGRKLIMTPPAVKVWALEHTIPVTQPENIRTAKFDGEWDVFIVAAYGKIIPESVLNIPRRKTINVHPSLLPLLRGSSPLQSAILSDMKDTGVTIMRLDKEMDHGPILVQKKADLATWPIDHMTLGKILAQDGADLIANILPSLLDGTLVETEQDHSKATYTQKITREDGHINFSENAYKNFLKFNAFKGWPGTYFFADMQGKRTRIVVTEATYKNNSFIVKRVVPEGKKEMDWDAIRPSPTIVP